MPSLALHPQELGATIVREQSDRVTHLVACSDTTDKARWALARGQVHLVSLAWLGACGHSWKRCDESEFKLKGTAAPSTLELQTTLVPPPKHPEEESRSW